MSRNLRKGTKVSWRSHGQTVLGTVLGKVTGRKRVAGRTVAASKDEPQFHVKSDKTGRDAVHKAEALDRRD